VNGYMLIPPSEFEGRAYDVWPGADKDGALYQAPPQLIEALQDVRAQPGNAPPDYIVKAGSYDLRAFAKLLIKIHHQVGLPRDEWRAAIFSLVAQYGKYIAYRVAHAIHDGKSQTTYQIDDLIKRARDTFQPGDSTFKTIFKYAHNNGITDSVPMSVAAMFGGTATIPDIDAILAEVDEEQAVPVIQSPPLVSESSAAAGVSGKIVATVEDFVAFLPGGTFCYLPTREHWQADGVNALLGDVLVNGCEKVKASAWLRWHRRATQMTWCPGQPPLVEGRLLIDGCFIERPADTTLNNYRPPSIEPREGDPSPWLNHIRTIYPDDAAHIIQWLAHRVQRPGEKINHALVLGGEPGVGKDSLLEPIKAAVGPWNFCDATPTNIMGRFNGHLKAVVLRISEVHDLGDVDRFSFYERTKPLCAAPPDTLRIDEKNLREYQAVNVVGTVMTTNYKAGGLYLPANDRRTYVGWSPIPEGYFSPEYFDKLYRWFERGGNEIVAWYLSTLDISGFNPKAPPRKTAAFWEIVNASRSPESAEMDDVLDALGTKDKDGNVQRPKAVTLSMLVQKATGNLAEVLRDKKYRSQIPHRIADAGYELVCNETAKDGLWKVAGKRQSIYSLKGLSTQEKAAAAKELQAAYEAKPHEGQPPWPQR
jgi:hypothetical protein